MKRFLLIISVFAVYIAALHTIFPVLVDPFNIFHADSIRDNGIQPNQNYIRTKYILGNKDTYNGFLFGSSRVGAIHTDKIPGAKVYNMAYPNGLPSEHLANIMTFLESGIKPSVIYIGVDSISYTEEMSDHIYEQLRCPYEVLKNDRLLFCRLYLNPAVTMKSLAYSFIRNGFWVNSESFYNYGWTIPYRKKSSFDWENGKLLPVLGRKFNYGLIDDAINDLRKISDLCNERGIKLFMFTNPMHHVTYSASLEKGYCTFLEKLAEISGFWNFSSLNDITLNNANYLETSHYRAEVGDMMINVMCSGEVYPELQAQGFGVKVTRENVKELTAMLKKQAEDFRHNNSPVP